MPVRIVLSKSTIFVCPVHSFMVVMSLIALQVYSFAEFSHWFVKILLKSNVIYVIHSHVIEECLHIKKLRSSFWL